MFKHTVEEINKRMENEERSIRLEGSGPVSVNSVGIWFCLTCDSKDNKFKKVISKVLGYKSSCKKCWEKTKLTRFKNNEDSITDYLKTNGINVKYVSGTFEDGKSRLQFQCETENCQHQFETMTQTLDVMIKKKMVRDNIYGCPKCSRKASRSDPKEINQRLIKDNRTMRLIEETYINESLPCRWICLLESPPHEFTTKPRVLLRSNTSGCRACDSKRKKRDFLYTNEQVVQQMKARGVSFKWVGGEYKGANSKIIWECDSPAKHQFSAKYMAVVYNHKRCPLCHKLKSESMVMDMVKEITGITLTKDCPDWLVNPKTKKRLELDGVSHEHKLAVEVQGRQHLKYDKFFHESQQTFIEQQERDELKRKICKERNYTLIEVQTLEFFKNDKNKLREAVLCKLKKFLKSNSIAQKSHDKAGSS